MNLLHTLQWRIVIAYTTLIIISMGAVSIYLVSFVRDTYISNLEERLTQEAGLVGESTRQYFQDTSSVSELIDTSERIGELIDARITVISIEGRVMSDTWENPSVMDNHASRPEFQAAFATGMGKHTRVSKTVGEELLYIATPIIDIHGDSVGVARIAVPTSKVKDTVDRIITTIILSAIVVTVLSIALGYFIARRTSRSVQAITEAARRLAAGDLEQHVEALTSDETQDMATAFNSMSSSLRNIVGDLSGERNKLSAVLDTMADGVMVIYRVFYLRQGEGIIDLVNPAAEKMLDIIPGEAIGNRFMETVKNLEIHELVSLAFASGNQQYGEIDLVYPTRFLSVFATPLTEGEQKGVLLTIHDLTSIRRTDMTRKQFVSNVSHELRSPLASVKAMIETLENRGLQDHDTATEFVSRIHKDINRITGIVEDLLELSRLESDQVSLELVPTDLASLVEEVIHEFLPQATSRQITLKVNLPDSLPLVTGEKNKLHNALSNLLDNALKFTPTGGNATLSVAIEENDLQIDISDTGIGIAEEHHPHIFERFYRVDSSRQYSGTGLGLAITKHIIRAHGSDIKIESHIGEGSTFSFKIPISY